MIADVRAALPVALLLLAAGELVQTQQPASAGLAGLIRDVACAPASPTVVPSVPITVTSGREARKGQFGTGDTVVISGGTAHGVRPGDEFYARRVVKDNFTEAVPGGQPPISVHTAGMIQIVEAQTDTSIGVVTYGCDGILTGDYLERFQPPVLPSEVAAGTPDYARPGHLILGDERRQIGGTGDFMVLDRGSDHGLRPGQRVTIFRHALPRGGGPVATIGSATVYVVRPESSVVRIEESVEAVTVGDLVAIHR